MERSQRPEIGGSVRLRSMLKPLEVSAFQRTHRSRMATFLELRESQLTASALSSSSCILLHASLSQPMVLLREISLSSSPVSTPWDVSAERVTSSNIQTSTTINSRIKPHFMVPALRNAQKLMIALLNANQLNSFSIAPVLRMLRLRDTPLKMLSDFAFQVILTPSIQLLVIQFKLSSLTSTSLGSGRISQLPPMPSSFHLDSDLFTQSFTCIL